MLSSLLYEKYKASNLPEELERLYENGEFDKRGFDKVEFMKFFDIGHRVAMTDGMLTEEDVEVDQLFYVIDGSVGVSSSKDGGRHVAHIRPYSFIGEMTFLMYGTAYFNKVEGEEKPTSNFVASANTVAQGKVTMWVWDFDKLAKALKKDRALRNAFAAYCNHDLRIKLLKANDDQGKRLRHAERRATAREAEESNQTETYWDYCYRTFGSSTVKK